MVGAQQHVRVAVLAHRAGDARVVDFVETLHGLVAVVLSALQQVVHGHGAAVVVDVVAALAVGEDLGEGLGWPGPAILIDSGLGMRQTREVVGENEPSELGKYCASRRAVT